MSDLLYHFVQFSSHASRSPSWTPNSHARHADFEQVPNSFGKYMPDMEFFRRLQRYTAKNFHMSWQVCEVAEFKISAGPSRITPSAELNKMVQYVLKS